MFTKGFQADLWHDHPFRRHMLPFLINLKNTRWGNGRVHELHSWFQFEFESVGFDRAWEADRLDFKVGAFFNVALGREFDFGPATGRPGGILQTIFQAADP